MKKMFENAIIVTLIISIILCPLALAETFSIRNGISFGMTIAQVKKAETAKVSNEEKSGKFISYSKINISGIKNSTLEYHFENKKLNSISMIFNADAAKITLEKEYKALNAALKDKYGKPLGYTNGKTADLTSGYFDAQLTVVKMDKMLGGKLQYKVTYDEWLIPTDGGKVKIEHGLFTSNKKIIILIFFIILFSIVK